MRPPVDLARDVDLAREVDRLLYRVRKLLEGAMLNDPVWGMLDALRTECAGQLLRAQFFEERRAGGDGA